MNAPQVLVRVEPVFAPNTMFTAPAGYRLWLTAGPEDWDYRNGEPWTWEHAAGVYAWDLASPYWDEHGQGFWSERTARVPARGCAVTTRARSSFTRPAFRVARCRVVLLHCPGECTRSSQLLNAIFHACPRPEGAREERVPVRWTRAQEMTPPPIGRISFGADVRPMTVHVTAVDGMRHEVARLALTGSGWTAERVRAAGEALRAHLADAAVTTH
ncbi:hypothetical protein OG762_48500 (plasmid) [Streptomyces sp. NBC_01136]|uniref:hypothetical protein n=1 Tax=unclassified Streptomyces TaxID=2593676 RepID=UPI0032545938|nr:hypothetical protein OG762_48500 [Streptomyces sp. NBC_01136]